MPRLEDEIKQNKPFATQEERALVNLRYTARWINDHLNYFFKSYGITPTQYNILRILRGSKGPITTSYIRERMLYRKSDTTRIIERMRKKEWLTRQTNVGDRRLVDIQITDIGRNLLEDVDSSEIKLYSIMSGLSEDQCTLLADLLDQLRDQ